MAKFSYLCPVNKMEIMKRIVRFLTVAAILLVAASCSQRDTLLPSAKWETNSRFATVDITNPMDADITYSVPEGLSSFTLTWVKYPTFLLAVLNDKVGLTKNKGTASSPSVVYAPMEDTAVASYFASIGMTGIRPGVKSFVFSFSRLINDLIAKYPEAIAAGDIFTFELALVDASGNEITNTASFRYLGVPTVYFDPETVDLGVDTGCKLYLTAPGKVAELTLTVSSSNENINSWFSKRSSTYSAASPVIDLVNDADAKEYLSTYLPVGNSIVGSAKSMVFDLSGLMKEMKLEIGSQNSSGNTITLSVTDQLGWSNEATVTFNKSL